MRRFQLTRQSHISRAVTLRVFLGSNVTRAHSDVICSQPSCRSVNPVVFPVFSLSTNTRALKEPRVATSPRASTFSYRIPAFETLEER
ncbi:hypothetical protein BV25DRAFT_597791 [Artomyces pyxidatus]|uniref:Uncharacterized protein n=1 Tax=Artomyces pyxidatus TaxID=48021 RepID=A0ACB8T3H0_9AGAM|nr:hypothetical protein BV25DRAFT_597791 [Artomyces pyxidatus]